MIQGIGLISKTFISFSGFNLLSLVFFNRFTVNEVLLNGSLTYNEALGIRELSRQEKVKLNFRF